MVSCTKMCKASCDFCVAGGGRGGFFYEDKLEIQGRVCADQDAFIH